MGIAPEWYVAVWGDHSRQGMVIPSMLRITDSTILANHRLPAVLAAYGVTHLLTPLAIRGPELHEIEGAGPVHLYEVPGKRARVVQRARAVASNLEAALILTRPGFDPEQEILVHAAPSALPVEASNASEAGTAIGDASIVEETSRRQRLQVNAPQGGFLLLADMYYPGWHATVDGADAPIFRANVSLRAVPLSAGTHRVEFFYDATPFFRGLKIACAGLAGLLIWVLGLSYRSISRRRVDPQEADRADSAGRS
jgi:hypothetical protein